MKNRLLFLLIICCPTLLFAQDEAVFTIDGVAVSRTEVEKAYLKNKVEGEQGKDDFAGFVDSYINFKLNVTEAKAQKLDTLASVRRSVASYKQQISRPYLQDTVADREYIRNVYERFFTDIQVNHVLIPYEKQYVVPQDTLELYQKALATRTTLAENGFAGDGYIDYTKESAVVPNIALVNGHLGWVRPFMLPAPVENAVYNTPTGELSLPIRSNLGYHIIQVVAKRPAAESLNLDQVLFNFPSVPPTQAQKDSVMSLVQEIYDNIKSDADFEDLCVEFAETYNTGEKGCSFNVINFDSPLPPSFIYGAYDIKDIGQISLPTITDYGIHIIRLKERIAVSPPPFEKAYNILRNKVAYGDFSLDYVTFQQRQLLAKYDIEINADAIGMLYNAAKVRNPFDSLFIAPFIDQDKTLFSVGDNTYSLGNFARYVESQAKSQESDKDELAVLQKVSAAYYVLSSDELAKLLAEFIIKEVDRYMYANLEKYNPAFKESMNAFEDEQLFFEAKMRNVWQKTDGTESAMEKEEKKWNDYLRTKYAVEINKKQLQK